MTVRTCGLALLLVTGCRSTGPREETVAVTGTSIQFEMVHVPGGRFTFGNREIELRAFWISRREVTWEQFDCFYEFPEQQKFDGVTRPSSGKNYLQLSGLPRESMEPDRPVTNLRFHSAVSYCEWLSKKTGQIFRLPTDAEWQFASQHVPGMPGGIWEYCLEPDRPPAFDPVLRGRAGRTIAPSAWWEADPNRPHSTWWFRDGHAQGFRVVRMPEGSSDSERREYVRKIEISGLKGEDHTVKVGKSAAFYTRVSGELRNAGDRPLEELCLKVYFLDPAGKPHLEDALAGASRRATFNLCFPVLANSCHPGDHVPPLRPGERRAFAVDLPTTFDGDDSVQPEKFGAEVLHLRFTP